VKKSKKGRWRIILKECGQSKNFENYVETNRKANANNKLDDVRHE
jgi:hypothetical protein